MKQTVVCLRTAVVLLSLVLSSAFQALAANGNWDGEANNLWTNRTNWSDNNQAFPSGDETATFNGGGNNRTNIDITALTGIANITFDGVGIASYNIGLAPANSQTNVFRNNGTYRINSNTKFGSSQRFDAAIQLGVDRAGGTYTFINDSSANMLTVAGDLFLPVTTSAGTISDRTLQLNGLGQIRFLGNIAKDRFFGAATNLDLTINNSGTVTMLGTNTFRYFRLNGGPGSVLDIGSGFTTMTNAAGGEGITSTLGGTIKGAGAISLCTGGGENYADSRVDDVNATLAINCRLTGGAGFEYYTGAGVGGTFALNGINDFSGHIMMNASGKISASKFGNRGSTTSNLGAGSIIGYNSNIAGGPKIIYTGTGESSDRIFRFQSHGQIEQAGTGLLNLTAPFLPPTGSGVTISLLGSTAGTGEIGGAISNGNGVAIAKWGTGTWTLSGSNTYASATTINQGTLAIAGTNGSIQGSSGISVAVGSTLLLNNTAAANHPNRIKDSGTVTLSGGTLRFQHTAGAASYSENVGTLALSAGANTIAASQAAVGQTSILSLAALTRTAGTVDFVGLGLGTDARNRILIAGQANGLIGPWATVNGSFLAAYDATLGVYPAGDAAYTDISARGPSTIPDSSAANIRINSDGTSGPIDLAAATTTVNALLQNTATDATVDTASKTLRTSAVLVPADKADVTLGVAAGDGTLSTATAGGTLTLANGGPNDLTVNAVIADHTTPSPLSKSGAGKVTLAAGNTFSGATTVGEGSLILAHTDALQNSTLALGAAAPVFDSSVVPHAFTLGGLSGSRDLPLTDNAGNALSLAVGKNNGSTSYSGVLSGPGTLTKQGTGTLTLDGTNSFSGGLTISAGKVVANQQNALGSGWVVNNGTLDLAVPAQVTYSGLSTSMAGSGTVNVTLFTGGYTTPLNGDYAGFTGTWNIGVGAPAGAAKVMMNGRDNAAATIIVRTNGTVMCGTALRHSASLVLQGGNTGESNGQLRLDNNAEWFGSILLAGLITDANDGFLGCGTGTGYISGPISDGGTGYVLDKVTGNTIVITGTNNPYVGKTWIKNGTLRAVTIKNVGEASSLGTPASAENGAIKIGNGTTGATLSYAGMGNASDRIIELAGTTGGATLDHSGTNTWSLTGGMTVSAAGTKTLTLQGSTIGVGEFASVISNAPGSMVSVTKNGTGAWKLSGDNTYTGNTTVSSGTLIAGHPHALGTTGWVLFPNTVAAIDFAHDGVGEIPYGFQMNAGTVATLKSNLATPGAGINHNLGQVWLSTVTVNVTNGANVVSGTPSMTFAAVNLWSGSAGTTVLAPTTADLLIGTITIWSNNVANKTVQLDGTSQGSAVLGSISNGLNTVLLTKANTSTWTLYGSNTYSGATAINRGLLALTGPNGTLSGNGAISIAANSALEIRNSVDTNHPNRLSDSAAITMNGGKLRYLHTGGAATYSETAGTLTVGSGASAVEASRADESQTSTLTFNTLSRTGSGTVNFVGNGLGAADNRNRILFTSAPALSNGIIGPWALYNGEGLAAYDGTLGVIPVSDAAYTDITALGPSAVPNNATFNARINAMGTEGPIALEGAPASSVNTLFQNTEYASTVGMTNQTLQVAGVLIGAGKAALTLGTVEGEGMLTPLTSGGNLQLINHSAGTLTVNALLTNNVNASTLTKSGTGRVRLNGVIGHTGGTTLGEGELVLAGTSTQTVSHVFSGVGILAKEGTGRITLSGANTYEGVTVVREGVLVAQNNAALGSSVSGTIVTNGGTLDLGGTLNAQGLNLNNEVVTVSGTGVNGRGAIINSSANSQYNALRFLALSGDATFGGENPSGRWDVRNASGASSFLMNGYAVTKVGTNMVGLTNTPVDPGATGSIDIQQGTFRLESATLMNGSPANVLTVQNGGIFEIYSLVAPIYWSLVINNGGRYSSVNGGSLTQSVWVGPATLNGVAYFDGTSGTADTMAGEISGSGSLVKLGSGSTTYLTSTNNSYAGTTTASNGTLWAFTPGSLPGWNTSGRVHLSGLGALAVSAGDGTLGWTSEQINTLIATSTVSNDTAQFTIDTTYASVPGLANLQKAVGLNVQGTNVVTLSGFNTNSTALVNNGYIRVYGGGTLNVASGSSNVFGRVVVQPGSTVGTLNLDGTTKAENMYVGNANGDRSRVNISTNVNLLRLFVGNNAVASGAVVQNDGLVEVATNTGNTQVFEIGMNGGYGYYRLNGGSLRAGRIALCDSGAQNQGVFDIFGGTAAATVDYIVLGQTSGNGIINLFGGSLIAPPGVDVTFANNANVSAFGMLNLLGPDAVFDATGGRADRSINLANSAGNLAQVFNLNAGTLLANRVRANTITTPSFFNFNGGTLRANAGTALGATFMQGLSAATVYPGGALIDSSNAMLTVNQNLVAPTGLGVGYITVFNGGAGYIGAPVVMITGGSGTGATAVASVDLATNSATSGKITGIRVTSPGVGYQSGDTLVVTLQGGGFLSQAQAGVSLMTPNSSTGGLTKYGAGTLMLGGTNTYGGATTVAGGTLSVLHRDVLPTNAVVNVTGGFYDLNGLAITNGTLNVTAGTIVNGTLRSDGMTKTGPGTLTLSAYHSFATPVSVQEGTLKLSGNMPGLYEGRVAGAFNNTAPNPKTATPLSTRYGNIKFDSSAVSGGAWVDNSTYVYNGFLWNNSGTNALWSFGRSFDDSTFLKIDSTTLFNGGSYNVPQVASFTLTPGAHPVEMRFGQGGGGVGPNIISNIWLAASMGMGYDPQGRMTTYQPNLSTTLVPFADPGDGSLLTLTNSVIALTNLLDAATSIAVAAGATVDLGGTVQTLADLGGSGLVSNGLLTVTGNIAPGGPGSLGTLTLAATVAASGTLLADIGAGGSSDRLAVQGNLDITGLDLVLANQAALDHSQTYTLITCTGTLTGTFASSNLADTRWHVRYAADGTVTLIFVDGTLLNIR